ncbi:glycerophosphodiester phosphodiesterase [Bacillus sp. B1-b2]|uniref:glycerophosphodiester phosphodiesterase n=1 Tax=Bacillus sp. B1-b2 TaxID=2653201 RepID=UPI0012618423|nr:glycerophosphodiester phosphodiesterase [Bacillus sp. B1-b2]KAB7669963.1 glycerophosphodiester phosphodiesterase [Bacillus sp. B1-b2]
MTQIFAHRGYAAKFPENTMIAFMEAEKVKADGIELDIQMTKDNEVVIIHDEKVDRTTDGSGYVKDLTLKDIRSLNAAKKFPNLPNQLIPSLVEFLDWMKDTTLVCNIELKNNKINYEGMLEKTIQLIRNYGLENRIIFSSFNHYSLVQAHRIAPEIETAPLLSDGIYQPWIYANAICAKGFHPNYRRINKQMIQQSEMNHIKVRAYTVNHPSAMNELIKTGISGIITDEPKLAKELLAKN